MAYAAILEQPGEGLKIGEVEYSDPAPHEVLIDTKACGLCHSDLHFIARIREAGAAGYLAKPVSILPFMNAVKQLLPA